MSKKIPTWTNNTDEEFWHMIDDLDRCSMKDLRWKKDSYIAIMLDVWESKQ